MVSSRVRPLERRGFAPTEEESPSEGCGSGGRADDGGTAWRRIARWPGCSRSSTIVLAAAGEALVLTHVAGALGLILLACGAAAGIAGWVALGAPRTRGDISA